MKGRKKKKKRVVRDCSTRTVRTGYQYILSGTPSPIFLKKVRFGTNLDISAPLTTDVQQLPS